VVHLDRLADGTRKVVKITEVQGLEQDTIVMQDIFQYVQVNVGSNGVEGHFTATGVRPKFMEKIEAAGIGLPPTIFAPTRRKERR
jgi:pilus assembly protein CpaF